MDAPDVKPFIEELYCLSQEFDIRSVVRALDRELVRYALHLHTTGKGPRAAMELGISRTGITEKLKSYGDKRTLPRSMNPPSENPWIEIRAWLEGRG